MSASNILLDIRTVYTLHINNYDVTLLLCTQTGWTAVMLASQNGHEGIVRMLITAGANLNMKNMVNPQAFCAWMCRLFSL